MNILTLTTSQAVRAVLGIDDHDYSDTQLTELGLGDEIKVHVPTWFPLWETLMDDDTGDSDIERQQLAMKIYVKFYCARVTLSAAPMAFLQRRSDGEVESNRFNDSAIENLTIEIDKQLAIRRAEVLAISTAMTPPVTLTGSGTYPQFSRAENSRDIISSE